MATRFTFLDNSPKKRAPAFAAKRQIALFLSIARAEIAMVCALVLVFWNLHGTVGDAALVGGLIVASAAASLAIRQSAAARSTIFIGSILAAEVLLALHWPMPEIPITAAALFFIIADIALFRLALKPEEENG